MMFLLLTPILVLAVVALLGFVGCSFQGGSVVLSEPTGVVATAGNSQVALAWTAVEFAGTAIVSTA